MIIKNIKIEHFEGIEHYESPFQKDFAVISGLQKESVLKAIGLILNNRSVIKTIENIRDDTQVEAEVELNEGTYKIIAKGIKENQSFSYTISTNGDPPVSDYFNLIQKNEEEEKLSWFSSPKIQKYSERLQQYMEFQEHYSKSEFSSLTSGIGTTYTFRNCLKEFIKKYRPHSFEKKEDWEMNVHQNGKFIIMNKTNQHRIYLSEAERYLFEFECFLEINEYWDEIEKIRDMNREKIPMIIEELVDMMDSWTRVKPYLEMAKNQNRQVFIGTNENKVKLPFKI